MKRATGKRVAGFGAIVFFLLSANLFCEPCAQPGVVNRDLPCRDPISRASGRECESLLGFEALDFSTAVAASLFVGVMLYFIIKAREGEVEGSTS